MKHLRAIWQAGKLAIFTAAGWLATEGAVWAQQPKQGGDAEGGSYVASYSLVILAVALGVFLVCRPAGRRDRAKPEVYDEIKTSLKEE